MRIRRLYLIVALIAAALPPRSVARADLNYRTEITGIEDNELALRRRADRDLGRLADAAVGELVGSYVASRSARPKQQPLANRPSRCFCCFCSRSSAGDIVITAEILEFHGRGGRKNSG
jgi:hypothetical protein